MPVRVCCEPLEMGEDQGVLFTDVYGRLDDARAYLRRALAPSLGVPAEQLSLADGGLLTRLGEGTGRGPYASI